MVFSWFASSLRGLVGCAEWKGAVRTHLRHHVDKRQHFIDVLVCARQLEWLTPSNENEVLPQRLKRYDDSIVLHNSDTCYCIKVNQSFFRDYSNLMRSLPHPTSDFDKNKNATR